MDYKNILIQKYPLTNLIDVSLNCYCVKKRRYIFFLDELVKKDNLQVLLEKICSLVGCLNLPSMKTFIFIGETDDTFKTNDLFWFDGVSTFAVFYLIDIEKKIIYKNDDWIFAAGFGYRKIIKQIDKIVKSSL